MNNGRYVRILRGAAVSALIALALIVWSLLHPRPLPVIVAMSVAQALGTLSLVALLCVLFMDLSTKPTNEKRGK